MRTFVAIFIRYFATIFSVLFGLMLFWQYFSVGKVDLNYALVFSAPISVLGASLAAMFIGGIRKLQARNPWVQPSEYITRDSNIIIDRLLYYKKLRIIAIMLCCLWLPFGIIVIGFGKPIYVFMYMAVIGIVALAINFFRCPRCGHYYCFRGVESGQVGDSGNETINMLLLGGYRNILTNTCLNCGLSVNPAFASNKPPS